MAVSPSDDHVKFIRLLLEFGVLIANVGVFVGVALERDKYSKTTQERGWKLLLVSLALEAAFNIFLYLADNTLSGRQQLALEGQRRLVADLNARNLTLEEEIEPRRIKPDDVPKSVLDELLKYNGATIAVGSYAGDVESTILATQLVRALGHRFTVQDRRLSEEALGGLSFAVRVTGKNGDLVNALMALFSSAHILALNEAPVKSPISVNLQNRPAPDVTIFVGPKPPP